MLALWPAGIIARVRPPDAVSTLLCDSSLLIDSLSPNECFVIIFLWCPKVYVCYDKRLTRLPVWLLYFEGTDWVVHTTEGPFGVWRKRYAKGQVRPFSSPYFDGSVALPCKSVATRSVVDFLAVSPQPPRTLRRSCTFCDNWNARCKAVANVLLDRSNALFFCL